MFLQKLKNVTVVALVLALLAAGGSGLVYQSLTAAPQMQVPVDPPPAAAQAKGKVENKDPDKGGPEKPRQLVTPKKGGVERVVGKAGRLTAFESVEVMSQVSGTLKKLHVDIGDRVKTGDLLAEIDAPDLRKDREQAAIALELAKAKVLQQEALLEIAAAEHRSARTVITQREAEVAIAKAEATRWEKEQERAAVLVKQKVFDVQTFEDIVRSAQTSKGRVDAAKAAVETAKAEAEIKKSRGRLAEAALEIEKLQMDSARVGLQRAEMIVAQTRITAPFDGLVTTRNANVGDVFSAKNLAPMFRIIRTDRMRAVFQFPERDAVHIRTGMPASGSLGSGFYQPFNAKVSRISSSLDPKTNSMRVEIDIPNPDGRLLEGMYSHADINLGILRPDALTIPLSCVSVERFRPGQPDGPIFACLAKDGKAVWTNIEGRIFGDFVEVYSGLRADDRIVADPDGVKDGDAVPKK